MTTETPPSMTTSTLMSRHTLAEPTMAFHFEKPVGWTFKACQFLDITLLDGNTRGFSIASARLMKRLSW